VDNCLYVNGDETLHVFKVKASLTEPLEEVTEISMACYLRMIVRIGPELLLLGMGSGVLSILDIESCIITHSHIFLEFMEISDCIVLDASHFLLAADEGVFKVTKSEVIKQSFKEKVVNCICHVTDSVYLLTLPLKTNLIVWNEDSD